MPAPSVPGALVRGSLVGVSRAGTGFGDSRSERIDEQGRVCRPHDAQFGTDTFTAFHGKASGPYLDMLRAWVREGKGALAPDEVRRYQPVPTPESQQARAERALAWHLEQAGRSEAAERHWQ